MDFGETRFTPPTTCFCPRCGSPNIRPRAPLDKTRGPERLHDEHYHCDTCDFPFEPVNCLQDTGNALELQQEQAETNLQSPVKTTIQKAWLELLFNQDNL